MKKITPKKRITSPKIKNAAASFHAIKSVNVEEKPSNRNTKINPAKQRENMNKIYMQEIESAIRFETFSKH